MRVICKCVNRGGHDPLTVGKVYDDAEHAPGIFPDRPMIAVTGDNGKRVTAYAWRFEVIEEGAQS